MRVALLFPIVLLVACQSMQEITPSNYVRAANDTYMAAVSTTMDLIRAGVIDKEAALEFVKIRDVANRLLTAAEETIAEGGEPDFSELREILSTLVDFATRFSGGG